ncbi:Transcriptional regulator, AraC family [Labilithrix luteola]|uniref:Transcriptional regulator, AraC family n=1 Tax=Labilithrix luteola TaxID=1391654 RepID=A0A0K1PM70_9BACT|nr:AraC family transcriptional regulator [Labilithrix luteola]AKU94633.1 Transcriptional regulator, AraC family [Labilithrix luteola]
MDWSGDLEYFLEAPIGKYITGPSWLFAYPTAKFSALVFWGRLSGESLEGTLNIHPRVHSGASRPHVALLDARRVEHVDEGGFAIGVNYVRTHRESLSSSISQLAIVHSGGMLGSVAAGFFRLIGAPYQAEVFTDPVEALRWIALDDPQGTLAALDALYTSTTGTTELLRDLRAHLEKNLDDASLAGATRALGISERSLQRRLAESGTSFQKEVVGARVRMAGRALVESSKPLSQIAFDVGCASVQHFSTMFRKVTGMTPMQWRKRGT